MAVTKNRIWELDALRGLFILCVVLVHTIFDLQLFGFVGEAHERNRRIKPVVERFYQAQAEKLRALHRFSELERISQTIRANLKQELLIDVKVSLVNPMSLKRFEGKAKRVTDLRKGQE